MWRNWNLCALVMGVQNGATAVKVWKFLKKLKME